MPKNRLQADLGLQAPKLNPAARPNDTFVEQRVKGGSQAAQLAAALSSVVPSLARFGDQLFERKKERDITQGTEKARETVRQLDESRKTYADAVREGRIPAHLNPWMKQGYYEELGRTYAGRLQADLTSAIETDENLKDSVEMEDFRAFTSKFEKEWLDSNLPADQRNSAFTVGYGNRRDAILANLEAGWSAQTEQRFTQRSLAMFRDEAVTYMQDAFDNDQSTEQIGATLKQMLDDKHALGWGSRQTGQTLIDAISDIALEQKDVEVMKKLLKSIPRGPGEPDRSYAVRKTQELSELIFRARAQDRQDTEYERDLSLRDLKTSVAARFEEAQKAGTPPQKVAIDDFQAQALKLGDADLVQQITTVADAYKNQEYDDDNNLVAGFLNKLHRGPYVLKQAELDTALRDKNLSLSTYNSISNALQQAQDSAQDRAKQGKPFLHDDPDRNNGISILDRLFSASNLDETDLSIVRYRAQQAREQFDTWYARTYRGEEPPPSSPLGEQRTKEVQSFVNGLFKVWYPSDDSFSGTHKLSGEDLNWTSRPVDTPERLEPALTNLSLVLQGRAMPSPYLTSLLQIYGVGLDSGEELKKFLVAQRKFAPIREKKPSGAKRK